MAMKLGKHCYCEKPLAHAVYEASVMAEIAQEKKLVTQMGTQIHAESNYRRVVELVQTGAIGTVGEVHVWLGGEIRRAADADGHVTTGRAHGSAGRAGSRSTGTCGWARRTIGHTTPLTRRSSGAYWWDFGNGQLGDFFCHYCDLAFWALKLRHPTTVEAQGPRPSGEHGQMDHRQAAVSGPRRAAAGDAHLVPRRRLPAPWSRSKKVPTWGNAVLFIGANGMFIADYGKHAAPAPGEVCRLQAPATDHPRIPSAIIAEWIAACKTGGPTTCNFDYSGALTEAALLCNVALRTGKKLTWDAAALKAVGCPEADAFLRPRIPQGLDAVTIEAVNTLRS